MRRTITAIALAATITTACSATSPAPDTTDPGTRPTPVITTDGTHTTIEATLEYECFTMTDTQLIYLDGRIIDGYTNDQYREAIASTC